MTVPRTRKTPDPPPPTGAVPADWRALVFGVPGYDPTRAAAGCWFDPAAAGLAVEFIQTMLVHVEGTVGGHPFRLEPWQAAVVVNLFGWKRRDPAGRVVRRYRELFFYVGRKNGKTPMVAAVALLVFFCDHEAGQQGFVAAKDREQSSLMFRQMEGMVRANKLLAKRCKIYGGTAQGGQSRSFVKPDGGFLKIVSGEGGGKHGGNPHLVIIDELHEQDDRALVDALRTSMVSANRSQSLFINLTTADYDRPSVCNEKYDEAKRVRDNPERDPSFLPVIYEADPGDDPFDPATWRKANPNLGVSVSEFELARLASKAKDEPAFCVEFKRLHLNLRVQRTVDNAIDVAVWDACRGTRPGEDVLAAAPCYAGLDLGWRDDFAALVLIWDMGDGTVWAEFRFWICEGTRRDLRAEPFAGFVAGNWLTVTDGDTTDFEAIRAALDDARDGYDLRTVMMDPSYARSETTELMNAGFPVKEFRQNPRTYSVPWKWLAADGLKGTKLRHGGNPVARWMAGHVAVQVDGADGVMPKKRKSAEKIDGITAMLMGLAAYLEEPDRGGPTDGKLETVYGSDEGEGGREAAPEVADAGPAPQGEGDWFARLFGDD